MQKPDYYDRVNEDLLKLIPPDAKVVLEIGCGTGALAEAYRRVNPGVDWIGIEPNEEACKIAESRGVDVMPPMTVEEYNDHWKEEDAAADPEDGLVDCLIFGDVLEHLIDPWAVLKQRTSDLRPGGQCLASIPNIQHFATLYNLLQGNWTYTDEGTLDRTHLRFFTLKTIRELFDQAGLQIHEIRGTRAAGDEDGWKFWQEYAKGLDIDLKQTLPLQYVVRAVKPSARIEIGRVENGMAIPEREAWCPAIRPLHIHAIVGEACCARPRILEPFAALSTIPGVRCTSAPTFSQNIEPRATAENRILIQQRFRSLSDVDLKVQAIVAEDWIIIAELDDDPESPLYTHGQPFDPLPLRAVHAVQVSTERLAGTIGKWNPNVVVFENQIAELPPMREPVGEGDFEVAIFYGAQNRESDWAPIMEALNHILNDHPLVTVCVVHDKAFYDALETDNKKFIPFCDYATYRSVLRTADIALLPLDRTWFNGHKSDIKFLECAAEGVAVLMSEFAANQLSDDPHPNDAYRCYCDPYFFEKTLTNLINHPDGRRRTAQAAHAYVRDHRLLGQHFRKRLAWYQSLLSSKPDLDRSLRERVPELFRSSAPHTLQPAL